MARVLSFHKMVGTGNDFIVVDNRKGVIKEKEALQVARGLCRRQLSVGADGLLLLEKSRIANVRMRIVNPDGSEAEMCGNGVRCLAKFAQNLKIVKNKFTVETIAGIINIDIKEDVVKARLVDPKDLNLNKHLSVGGQVHTLNSINTGVPHAVEIVADLQKVDVAGVGRAVRYHDFFAPKGTNVNFVSILSPSQIEIRTYERGVEGETLACGTGSTAGALITAALQHFKSPIRVKTRGGENLKIYFSRSGDQFYDVFLEGKVTKSFEGRVEL